MWPVPVPGKVAWVLLVLYFIILWVDIDVISDFFLTEKWTIRNRNWYVCGKSIQATLAVNIHITYPKTLCNIITPLCINFMVCHFTEKKPSNAVDDSSEGFSLSIDRKSTTFSEVLAPPYPVLCDQQTYPLLYKDRLDKETKKLDYELRVHETASFHTLFAQHWIFPMFREQENPLSVVGVIRLTCRDYQFWVSLLCYVFFLFCCIFYLSCRFENEI